MAEKHKEEPESMHWADKIALQIKERVENNPILKGVVKKEGYIIYDEKTPSGTIHVGSARGWIIHDCIAKALRQIGIKAKFVLSSDDMDPYDKPNKELGSSWDKCLGMPFSDIPSPVKGYKSFGDYYFSQVTEKFDEWGIECELESTGDKYIKGNFNPQIKLILDNAGKVQAIYAELYGEGKGFAEKLPFNVKCPKCGKIATTKATKWDKEKELIFFECREDEVKFAKGCNYSGWISPYNGNGKFPWKVEWPAKWPMRGVIYEIAGKDHFSAGGSRTIGCRIAVDVLNYPPPLPSDGYKEGDGYEFFTVGGAKMSTSRGKGFAFKDITEYAPAHMLRYLMVKTRPNAVVDFNPYNDNDLLLLYDRYDKMEDIYFGKTEASEEEKKQQKRIYELSYIGKIPKKCPVHIPLNTASAALQIALFDEDKAIEILKKQGLIEKKVTKEDLRHIKERLDFAKKWVKEFASEQYKFELNEKLTPEIIGKLNGIQKKALKVLKDKLEAKDYDEKTLFEEFYKIKEESGIEVKDFFKAAYTVLINKEKGPKLAPFILAIGKERVLKILGQII
jgi:lysyl-tRNA synthetase class 1